MPFPRFSKLPLEKRERLMEAAAQEFATSGFDDASVNRILETVQMSKGAAYYYFEDKVDLFFTVIHYCTERLKLFNLELDPATLTAENFWPTFAERHRQPCKAAGRLTRSHASHPFPQADEGDSFS
jgi:AcrR family transcriptional regulator